VSVSRLIDIVFIEPLLVIYEYALRFILDGCPDVGTALVVFAVLLNAALLPVYYQMEFSSRRAASIRSAMEEEIARIKAHYTGRERYFYIRTIYRQYGHGFLSTLAGSADLLLQIVVFATVFRFLRSHEVLERSEWLGITDLSRPDGLLLGINILPLIMTLLNLASVTLYTRDRKKRGMGLLLAAVFLFLLYGSPAGLVIYWTANNAFSLVRNFVERKCLLTLTPRLIGALRDVAKQQ
jgi:YidC/Oxa1 family membrane protein insertase